MGYFKAIPLKKEQNNAICSSMDLEIVILSEISLTEKDKYHMTSHMWNLKYDTNEHTYERETDSYT